MIHAVITFVVVVFILGWMRTWDWEEGLIIAAILVIIAILRLSPL